MKVLGAGLAGLLWTLAASAVVQAMPPHVRCPKYGCCVTVPYPLGVAPDACGCGYYTTNVQGMTYGPNHYVYPPFPPFGGLLPVPANGGRPAGPPWVGGPVFPTHPYARSPRDYFMMEP